jgi:5-methylcytosine-specific restriction endonuclease McrA
LNLQADHIVPASRGGSDLPSNGRTLCRRCHLKHTGEQFGFGGTLRTHGGRSSS